MLLKRIVLAVLSLATLGRPANATAAEESSPPQPQESVAVPAISRESVRRHIDYLASPKLEGRGTSRGKQLARDYIKRELEEMHLEPLFGESGYEQNIPGVADQQGQPTSLGKNLGGWIRGSDPALRDEFVILSAHYDHLGVDGTGHIYAGADDNAGSVAMLLEVARQFATGGQAPRRSLVFLSCDLEEKMLWGARWFVAHPPWPMKQVKLFITAEMIGRTLGDLPLKTIFVMGSEHGSGLRDIVNSSSDPAEMGVSHLGIDIVGTRSDYGPFQSEKVPFLFFSGGQHPDYHTPRDTPERVDATRVARVSNLIAAVCRKVAQADSAPTWIERPSRDLDEIRTLHGVTDLVLKADAAAVQSGGKQLSQTQRFTVTSMHQKTAQILARGTIQADERPWIIRTAQLLLLTVF
jgi:Zn-dependent M28 family amino/carboxypeptidase